MTILFRKVYKERDIVEKDALLSFLVVLYDALFSISPIQNNAINLTYRGFSAMMFVFGGALNAKTKNVSTAFRMEI